MTNDRYICLFCLSKEMIYKCGRCGKYYKHIEGIDCNSCKGICRLYCDAECYGREYQGFNTD